MVLITDNGSNFTLQEFSQFLHQCDIQHITSSAHHHQGNGRAEAAVKVAKGLLKRSLKDRQHSFLDASAKLAQHTIETNQF